MKPSSESVLVRNVRRLMEEQALTMKGLSTKTGRSESFIRDILSGKSQNPRQDSVQLLASALGVSVAALTGPPGEDPEGADDAVAERLLEARTAAGYLTADSFAAAQDIDPKKYRDQEDAKRLVTERDARAYAGALGTTWEWLLRGEGEPAEDRIDRAPEQPPTRAPRPAAAAGMVAIDEVDVRVGAGATALGDFDGFPDTASTHVEIRRTWVMPDDVTRPVSTSPASKMKIVAVVGDSMEPEYRPGERVLVDLGDITPSPPGTFVVWDGLALVIKQAEHVAWSDPPEVLLKSINPRYETYRRPLGEAYIQGRVIGKWLFRCPPHPALSPPISTSSTGSARRRSRRTT